MAVVTFSTEVWGTRELGTYSSRHQSRGQRHRRRWYRQRGCVQYGRREEISYQLCKLLQLRGQGCQGGVDVVFRDILSLHQLVEMVLQVSQGICYALGDIRRQRHLGSGIFQRVGYGRGGQPIGQLSTGIVQGSAFKILICCKGDWVQDSRRILRDQDEAPGGMFYTIYWFCIQGLCDQS